MSRTPDEKPPVGESWVDYATRHQHVGARPCWQCKAREMALAEVEEIRRGRLAYNVEVGTLRAENEELKEALEQRSKDMLLLDARCERLRKALEEE